MPIRNLYYPERSPLLQQLLGANLAQSGGPQSAVGSVASVLAAILAAKGIGDSNQQKTAQAAKLADVLSKQLAPNQQVSTSLEGVGGIPDQISSVTRMNPQQPDLKTALMAMEPQALQGLQTQLIAQQFGGTAPEKFASSPGGIYSERTGKITTPFPEKTPNTPDFEQQMTDLWGPMKDWTPEQRAKYEDSLLKKGTPPVTPGAPLSEDKPFVRDLYNSRVQSMNFLDTSKTLRKQLADNPALGFAGAITRGAQSIAAQAKQVAGMVTAQDASGKTVSTSSLLNPSNYDFSIFDKFGKGATESAASRSTIMSLAFMRAAANNPSGVISTKDVAQAMEELSTDSGSGEQISAALDQVDARVRTNIKNRYFATYNQPMPADWLGEVSTPGNNPETLPGWSDLTPAEQAELRQRQALGNGR